MRLSYVTRKLFIIIVFTQAFFSVFVSFRSVLNKQLATHYEVTSTMFEGDKVKFRKNEENKYLYSLVSRP